jgi:hypothetical protein
VEAEAGGPHAMCLYATCIWVSMSVGAWTAARRRRGSNLSGWARPLTAFASRRRKRRFAVWLTTLESLARQSRVDFLQRSDDADTILRQEPIEDRGQDLLLATLERVESRLSLGRKHQSNGPAVRFIAPFQKVTVPYQNRHIPAGRGLVDPEIVRERSDAQVPGSLDPQKRLELLKCQLATADPFALQTRSSSHDRSEKTSELGAFVCRHSR